MATEKNELNLSKKFEDLQKAMSYYDIEKNKLQHLEDMQKQNEQQVQKNIENLNEFITNWINPLFDELIVNLVNYAKMSIKIENEGRGIKQEINKETVYKKIKEEFLRYGTGNETLRQMNIPYSVELYTYEQKPLSQMVKPKEELRLMIRDVNKDENNNTPIYFSIKLNFDENGNLLLGQPNKGYLYDENSYKALFRNSDYEQICKNIKSSVSEYIKTMENGLLFRVSTLEEIVRENIGILGEKKAGLEGRFDFIELCNALDINTGHNDTNSNYGIRLYDDKAYLFYNSPSERIYQVISDIPITDILKGCPNKNDIVGILNDYSELLNDNFQYSTYFHRLDKEIQNVLKDMMPEEWSNILNNWLKTHPLAEDNTAFKEALEYYTPLCNWLNTERLNPITEDYLKFSIEEANEKDIEHIQKYFHKIFYSIDNNKEMEERE